MESRTFWVLDDDDRTVVADLAVGLGRTAARVLAYLLLRAQREPECEPATMVQLQVGTGLSRSPVSNAVTQLEDVGLIEHTTVSTDAQGRPPSAWQPTVDLVSSRRRVYEAHARTLLERAAGIFSDESSTADGPPEAAGDDELTVALNWHPNGLHVPLYTATASTSTSTWYDEYGVDVGLEHCEGSLRALNRVRSGEADVAIAGAATVLRARASGAPIVPIAVLYQRAMTVLYTVRDVFGEQLRSVEQLRDRRIGMPPHSETGVLGRLFISQTALEDAIEIVETAGEEREALLSGRADVVTGSVTDPQHLERRGKTVDTLLVTDHFPIYGPTIVVHEGALRERRDDFAAFLAGTAGGWADASREPGPAAARIAELGDDGPDRVRATFERAATEFGGSDDTREHGWGWQCERTWNRLRTALEQGQLLTEEP
ncbi:ABC transporter substrate-binding protein [Natronolimnohabitans sp. A-GB9]|uniref:ABC transporter substrate-binding protein n=1 Tax=Natronolimnohabitans sp. A-GB9 TaxID=3069757 RepID=UPI0027ADCF98|nr:ABC transporter substrate-binding protein [Natronolimnohabitans sp. A-GB9]MDQ2051761.1 ABC transporter substrate-binding protein [Natronolimnohabitans sp. A-GB9]